MKRYTFALIALLGMALFVSGCGKKPIEQANVSGTGFDSVSSNEELAQLPQAAAPNQQAATEVLPVEASPVTAPAATAAATTATETIAGQTLSYQQKIQTALKNAGYYNGAIDGKIGPGTRKAIQAFQKEKSLKADGKVGPKTWALLEPYYTGQAGASSAAASSAPASTASATTAAPAAKTAQ